MRVDLSMAMGRDRSRQNVVGVFADQIDASGGADGEEFFGGGVGEDAGELSE